MTRRPLRPFAGSDITFKGNVGINFSGTAAEMKKLTTRLQGFCLGKAPLAPLPAFKPLGNGLGHFISIEDLRPLLTVYDELWAGCAELILRSGWVQPGERSVLINQTR